MAAVALRSTTIPALTVTLAAGLAVLFGYWSAWILQSAEPLHADGAFQVRSLGDDASFDDVVGELDGIAAGAGETLTVEKNLPDTRVIYADSATAARWKEGGYPGLPPGEAVEAHELSELPFAEYRQTYYHSGRQQVFERYARALDERGIDYLEFGSQWLSYLLGQRAFGSLFSLAVFALAVVAFLATTVAAKREAVGALHGDSVATSVARIVAATPLPCWIFAAVATVAPPAWLAATGRGESLPDYLVAWVAMLAVFLAAAAAGLFAARIVLRAQAIPQLLRGKLATPVVVGSNLVVRGLSLVLVAGLVVEAGALGAEVARQREDKPAWQAVTDVYRFAITGARDYPSVDEAVPSLAAAVRELDAEGAVLFASATPNPDDEEELHYNWAAFERSLSPGPEGLGITDDDRAGGVILVSPAAGQQAAQWLIEEAAEEGFSPRVVEASGYSAFTWDAGQAEWLPSATLHEPPILVYPEGRLPNDEEILSAVSNGSLTITGEANAHRLATNPESGSLIEAVDPLAATWAGHHRTALTTLATLLAGLLTAVLILAGATVLCALAVRRAVIGRHRVYWLLGVPRTKPVAALVALEAIVAVVTAGYVLWSWRESRYLASVSDEFARANVFHPAAVGLVAAVVVASSALWLAIVINRPRRERQA